LLVNSKLGINSALLINRTLGLRSLEQLETRLSNNGARSWVGEQHTDAQGREWKKLNLRTLLSQPEFLDINI